MNYKNIKVYRGMYILKEHFEEQFQPILKTKKKSPQTGKHPKKDFNAQQWIKMWQ